MDTAAEEKVSGCTTDRPLNTRAPCQRGTSSAGALAWKNTGVVVNATSCLIPDASLVRIPEGHWCSTDAIENEWSPAMAKKKLIKGAWSKSDTSTLKKLFPNHPTAQVAAKLGRPTDAVKRKAYRMGLKKSRKHPKSKSRA
jgi:hypothetical protein